MRILRWTLLVVVAIASGCASIPPEAPELSTALGNRIGAMQRAHDALVKQYFADKRAKVDEFVEKVYVPQFAENFFAQSDIKQTWDEVVRSNDPTDKFKFITIVGPKLQTFINATRLEFIKPLEDLEHTVHDTLTADYNNMLAMNNSITSFLYSASKVEANRKRYLEMIGIKEEKVEEIINETDQAVTELTAKAEKLAKADERVKEFKSQIEKVKSKLKSK